MCWGTVVGNCNSLVTGVPDKVMHAKGENEATLKVVEIRRGLYKNCRK